MDLGYVFGLISYFLLLVPIQGSTVSDPCPADAEINKISVTMCTGSYVKEDDTDDSIKIDSVVFRVMQQQSNCVCHASLINQTQQTYLYVRPYGGYDNSVPSSSNCGVNIDISRTNTHEEQSELIATVGCIHTEYTENGLPIDVGEKLTLTSRVTDGNFQKGFCLQLYRVYRIGHNFKIQIQCYQDFKTSTKANDIDGTKTQEDTTFFTRRTTNNFESEAISPDRNEGKFDKISETEDGSLKYIIAGSSGGGGIILLLLLVTILCLCRRRGKEKAMNETTENDNSNQDGIEYDSYGLKDNVLYVSADEQLDTENANDSPNKKTSSTFEGNYSTVDIDEPRNSDEDCAGAYSTVDIQESDGNKYYNVSLQKPKPMLKPKPMSKKQQSPAEPKNMERDKNVIDVEYAVVNKGTTKDEYAVVNKTKRNDGGGVKHFSVEGTGDEYAMVKKQ